MTPKIALFIDYCKYILLSRTKYSIHSPFLFDLTTNVFNEKTQYPEFKSIQNLRNLLISDKRIILVTDYGAGGSETIQSQSRTLSEVTRKSSKPIKYGRLLFRLSKYFSPRNILELGTNVGLGSAWLASGNPDASVYTIEGCPELTSIARENFKKLKLDNISSFTGRFEEKLPEILDSLEEVHLVYIDGNHRFAPTVSYFEHCLTKSVNEALIVVDDICWSSEMKEAWQAIKDNKRTTLTVDLFFMGLVFINKGLSKQNITIRF